MRNTILKASLNSKAIRLTFALFPLLMGLLFTGRDAAAIPEFREAAMKVYGFKPGGALDKAQCNLCHTSVPQLNPYGASIKATLPKPRPKTLTAEFLHSLDSADADGDGVTNGDELKADTLPGDPASHPAGAPPTATHNQTSTNTPAAPSGEINPFDIKLALTANHAQHPVLVHFPIALFLISMLFDVLAIWRKNTALASAGYLNLCVAAVSSVVAVITGLVAWQWMFAGAPLDGNLRLHLILGSISTVLICVLWGIRYRRQKQGMQELGWGYLLIGAIIVATISLTGHIGGILSGVVKQ